MALHSYGPYNYDPHIYEYSPFGRLSDECGGVCRFVLVWVELRVLRRYPRVAAEAIHLRHNYIGHKYIGHKYIGRNYIGHIYIGHNYIGHNYIGHNYIGHNYRDHNYTGHDYIGYNYMDGTCTGDPGTLGRRASDAHGMQFHVGDKAITI